MTADVRESPPGQAVGRTLSRWTLAALTVGTMVGGGVFSLPGEFARSTGVVGAAIAWTLAGAGMLTLAVVFQRLSERRPDLDAGVYAYARAGFGRYAGFLSMIGYWAVAVLGNVVYWTLVMSTIGEWVPALRGGSTVAAVAASSAGLWFFHVLIARGVHSATALNRVVTVAKLVPLLVFVVIVGSAFDPAVFADNLVSDLDGGSIPAQLSGTIAVTVFVFIGVEGANTYSRYARRRRDVGWATITGFLSVLVLFVLVAMVGYGVLPMAEIAALEQPSVAGVLTHVVGEWGAVLVAVGLLVSVLGAYLAWSLMAAEVVVNAAHEGDLPAWFARENARKAPVGALVLTNATVQVFLLLALLAEDAFDAAVALTTSMVLVPYLLSAGFAVQEALAAPARRTGLLVVAVLAVAYTAFLFYGAGPRYVLMSAVIYAPATVLFVAARRSRGERALTRPERVVCGVVVTAAVAAVGLLATGVVEVG
ncbi:basic amino acid/polyamine antiporter [Cellulomonas triticagri]|uniref:Amino acid permease n=1 Tax=Cellulomonas triticagri TaxID=2483352 RepID=A0A3M2J3C2_9CELL|nr:basic amino acid/polyamine antiporter [Cellulomonas triticagri]RMI06551.1 amino acid permease [Cellulomonas triticagri]